MSIIAFIILFLWCASLSSRISRLEKPDMAPGGTYGAVAVIVGIVLIVLVAFFFTGEWL